MLLILSQINKNFVTDFLDNKVVVNSILYKRNKTKRKDIQKIRLVPYHTQKCT